MRRRSLVLLLVCVAAVVVAVAPVAANNKPTTGTQISLFVPPATFAANTPFFIEHGFACTIPDVDCTTGRKQFDLYLDSVRQPSTIDVDLFAGPPKSISKRSLTNFPAGLPAGPHTFVGVFVSNGAVVLTLTATITFS